jgi:hypothetical protein
MSLSGYVEYGSRDAFNLLSTGKLSNLDIMVLIWERPHSSNGAKTAVFVNTSRVSCPL